MADVQYAFHVNRVAVRDGNVIDGDALSIHLVALDDATSATAVDIVWTPPLAVDEAIVAAPPHPLSYPCELPPLRAPPHVTA